MKFFDILKGSDLWIFIGILIGGIVVTGYTAMQHYKSVKSGIEAEQAQLERDEIENSFRNRSSAADNDLINAQNIAIQKLQESATISKKLEDANKIILNLQQQQNDYLINKDTYCFIQDLKRNYPFNITDVLYFDLVTRGKYPLKNVTVVINNTVFDPREIMAGQRKNLYEKEFPSLIHNRREEIGPIKPFFITKKGEEKSFDLILKFSTENQTFMQRLSFIKLHGDWKKASMVVLKKPEAYEVVLKEIDKEYLETRPNFKWDNFIFFEL